MSASALLCGAWLAVAPEATAQDPRTAAGVAAASAAFDRAFNSGDMVTLETLLTEQTVMVVHGAHLIGRAEVVQANRELREERPGVSMESRPESIQLGPVGWSVASERGQWIERWTQDGEPVELRGTYHAVWRFREGLWAREALVLTPVSCQGPYCSG